MLAATASILEGVLVSQGRIIESSVLVWRHPSASKVAELRLELDKERIMK